jgi:CheY-like chemotaxis protein/anti-sigma regulatory factor (Ser/Thr protein kinase)
MAANILVVDDSQVERLLVAGLLRKNADYHVQLAVDGKDALAKIESQPPDLVITDLVMPEMDGLELVRTILRRHPQTPVILMTAYGDESTAAEALEAGAASYVPKARKAERLMSAVERVLAHAATERTRARLGQRMLEYHSRFALENDPALIRALVKQAQQAMADVGFGDTVERIRIGEALEEALLNAMYHGNLEIKRDELARIRSELDQRLLDNLVEERCREPRIRERKILVVIHLNAKEAKFVVRDQGRGFNSLRTVAEQSDPFEAGNHRGMTLIHSLMDEVAYNDAGNELVLRKRPHGVAARN